MIMRDLTRRQIRVLFELSNGKRLYVNETGKQAYLSDDGRQEAGDGDADHFQSFAALRDSECLIQEEQGAGDGIDVYAISPEGIERLLESSMRPEEG
jgi:hypothetical protein